ncbi:MAG: thiamine pyrophosphate-binding protein [Chloroflexi bacterium]|nr:thiamine pyrophosphate-binding protein [Chloroflexota bacterium]
MFGSDLIVQQLARLGIRHVALNPGATLRGLHESLLSGTDGVQPITCLHEGVAVGLAHGYAKALRSPMAVALHDTVGVLNATLGLYNAWLDEVPMMVLGGVGPLDATLRRPWIDWVHTTTDTPRPIRDMLTWLDQPSSMDAALESLRRGHARAVSTPPGPAWWGLDQGLLDARIDPPPADGGPSEALRTWQVAPDGRTVDEVAGILRGARRPVIVFDRPLSDAAAATAVMVATWLGAAMVELEGAANIPWGHPLDASDELPGTIGTADALLLLDVRDPGAVLAGIAAADRPVIDASAWPLRNSTWVVPASSGPVTHRLVGDVGRSIDALAAALGAVPVPRAGGTDPGRAAPPAVSDLADDAPLDKRTIAAAAAAVLPHERVVVTHGSLAGHARRALRLSRPSQYLGRSGGEGLGYALPASVGAALALRGSEHVAIAFLTDGDTLYLPQALWTAAHERIPLLAVVEDNRSYGRDALHQQAVARSRGRDEARAVSGVRIDDPPVDLELMARAMGVTTHPTVRTFGELRSALRAGLEATAAGEPFLIQALSGV